MVRARLGPCHFHRGNDTGQAACGPNLDAQNTVRHMVMVRVFLVGWTSSRYQPIQTESGAAPCTFWGPDGARLKPQSISGPMWESLIFQFFVKFRLEYFIFIDLLSIFLHHNLYFCNRLLFNLSTTVKLFFIFHHYYFLINLLLVLDLY